MQAADLRALVAILSAEGNGIPLTAGQLREQIGLSADGASRLGPPARAGAGGAVTKVRAPVPEEAAAGGSM